MADLETYETLYKRGNSENPTVHSMGFTKFDGKVRIYFSMVMKEG